MPRVLVLLALLGGIDGGGVSGDLNSDVRLDTFSGDTIAGDYTAPAFNVPTAQWDLYPGALVNGVDQLDPNLCINGTCQTPDWRYRGGDATSTTWPAWVYGGTLSRVSVSTPPTYNAGSPLFGASDDSVLINGSDYYQAATAGTWDVGVKDPVVEAVYECAAGATTLVASTYEATGGGFDLASLPATARTILTTSGGGITTNTSTVCATGAVVHLMYFVNRDENSTNGVRIYVNATEVATGNASTRQEALGILGKLTIGARADGTFPHDRRIMYVAAWSRASWLQAGAAGPTEEQAIAIERFAKLSGVWPRRATTYAPTTISRSSVATLRKAGATDRIIRLWTVGYHWPRVERIEDLFGQYLPEPITTNLMLRSSNLGTTWTKVDAGDTIGGGSTASVDGTTCTTCGIAGDSTDGPHGACQAVTLTATNYTLSAIIKKGSKSGIYLSDDTVTNAYAYFTNNSVCTVGVVGAAATARIEKWNIDDSVCRVSISFTGTAASHSLCIQPADGNLDKDFAGDGSTVNMYVLHAQVEPLPAPSSPIVTTTATVGRSADQLIFPGTGNIPSSGTIVCTGRMVPYDTPDNPALISLDDGSSANQIRLRVNSADHLEYAVTASSSGQASMSGAVDVSDGIRFNGLARYATNDFKSYKDAHVNGTPDTSGAVPTGLTTIRIGTDLSAASVFGGGIKRCRLFTSTTMTTVPERQVAILGDSISRFYGYYLQSFLGASYDVDNYSVGSAIIDQMDTLQYNTSVQSRDYYALALLGGRNDLAAGSTAAEVFADAEVIYSAAVSESIKPVGITILPDGTGGVNTTTLNNTNALIRATTTGATIFSATPYFSSDGTLTGTTPLAVLFNADHVHLNAAGSQQLARYVLPYVQ